MSSPSLADALQKTVQPLLFGFRLWISVVLALYIAFQLELDNAYWAGTSAAIMCQPHLGASLRKGWYRMVGTLVGAAAIVALTAWFPQDRGAFLVALALWGGACACVATLLRNFAAYAAALAGFTAFIIASDQLGAVGGLNGDAFSLAITRATEILIGIVSAGIVLAGTDLGGAPRRLASALGSLAKQITNGFIATIASAGSQFSATQAVRRDFLRRIIALDPQIDEALGESSRLRYHSSTLQDASDGLFSAMVGWREIAVLFSRMPEDQAKEEAALVLQHIPMELHPRPEDGTRNRWMVAPIGLRRACDAAVRRLMALPAETPSLRHIAIETAEVLSSISYTLEGMALLVDDPARPGRRSRRVRLRVPDWLPSAINGLRAILAIAAASLFWIVTAWPNGALALVWVSVVTIIFAPRAEAAYDGAWNFALGNVFALILAAIIEFSVLPQLQSFFGLSIAIGLYLVPIGALVAQPWRSGMFLAMSANLIPLLMPENQMSYDTVQFYNSGLALVAGSAVGAFSFRLFPPLSAAVRTRRLLALTLDDLRRLAAGGVARTVEDWQSLVYGRLASLPEEASPLQRAQLLTALSVGSAMIQLRRIARRFASNIDLEDVFSAFARGDNRTAAAELDEADRLITERAATTPATLRFRGLIHSISEALAQHAEYFAGASG
ncbi:MAG TPA: FUSC family protein [Stellaceae bacterium]|nr:FUSC family protein [Stellaceae bacterium]